MGKKIGMLAAALTVLAFAVPAMASASALLSLNYELLPAGTKFTATSSNFIVENAPEGPMECEEVVTENEIANNNGTVVETWYASPGSTTLCTFSEGEFPFYLHGIKWLNLNSTSPGNGTITVSFETEVFGTCIYEGEVPFTYARGADAIHLSGAIKTLPTFCEPAHVEGDFTLKELSGEPIMFT